MNNRAPHLLVLLVACSAPTVGVEGALDAGPAAPAPSDAAHDASVDADADVALLDAALPDAALPDAALPDVALPDATLPDAMAPKSCSSGADCGAEGWCSLTGCGFTTGFCEPRPTSCAGEPLYWICGCDGHSYPSACAARQAGALIAAHGVPCLSTQCTEPCTGPGEYCLDCASDGPRCVYVPPGQPGTCPR